MKKFVSVMLVLCMVLALVPAMAFAAGGVAQVDDKHFDTLKDAIDYAGVDGHSKRIDLKANTNEGVQLIINKDIDLQMNGYRLNAVLVVEKSTTLVLTGDGTLGNKKTFDDTTIYNHGTITVKGVQVRGVVENFGTMTFDRIVTEGGSTVNPGLTGYLINNGDGEHTGCSVTVNYGTYTLAGSSASIFVNYGTVTLNGGTFNGKLHQADSGVKADIAPVVNGGVYSDADVLKHRSGSTPVAGIHDGTNSDGTLYDWFMVGGTWIKTYVTSVATANVQSGSPAATYNVDFLLGDVKLDNMPDTSKGIWYWDAWKGAYTAWGDKVFNPAADPRISSLKLDGRGLVNGLSDFTIVAKKVDGIFSATTQKEQFGADLLAYNQKCVKKVESKYDRTNANEVWFTVTVTVDVDAITPFSVPNVYGNLIGPHKWIPIAIGFKGLNNDGVKNTLMPNIRSWNMIDPNKTEAIVTIKDENTTYLGLWVSGDHNDIGGNAGFEFVDDETKILYHVDIVVKDEDAGIPAVSEPDDKDNAETYPGDGKDKPATSTPAGTGAGDGPAKTGDNSTVMLWATLLIASAAGVAICVVDEAKKRSRK